MRHGRNLNPEWGYVAPASGFMRTARLIMLAAIVGATAGAAIVFSLLDRPVAEESVAARTLVGSDASWPVTAGTSVAAQQPTEPQQQIKLPAELQNSTEQKAPPVLAAGVKTRPQQSELATTLASQHPTSAAALAEARAVEDMPSAQTPNNTVAVAPDPASTSQPQSKGPRKTSRTASRNSAPRYDSSRYYARGYDGPRYGYGSRHGYEPRYGFAQGFAWAPYSSRNY
jgi:hypothetical protein